MKRLLVIADRSRMAGAIRPALLQAAGFRIVGFADGRGSVAGHVRELLPDVALVDDMEDPPEAIARLRDVADAHPGAKALLLASRMGEDLLDEAFDAGVDAVISKAIQETALVTVLRETVRCNVVHRYRRTRPRCDECRLTRRESEILGLAVQGYTNRRIARELWITEQTVKFHLSNTYRKFGVANRTEASHYAYVNDLIMRHETMAT